MALWMGILMALLLDRDQSINRQGNRQGPPTKAGLVVDLFILYHFVLPKKAGGRNWMPDIVPHEVDALMDKAWWIVSHRVNFLPYMGNIDMFFLGHLGSANGGHHSWAVGHQCSLSGWFEWLPLPKCNYERICFHSEHDIFVGDLFLLTKYLFLTAQVPHMSMTVWPKDVDINSVGSFFVFPCFGNFSFSAVCIPSFASSKQYSHFFCRVSFGKVSYFFLVKPRIFCWSNLFASVKLTICCLYPKCWFDQGLSLIFASLNLLSAGVTLILPGFTPNFVGFKPQVTRRRRGAGRWLSPHGSSEQRCRASEGFFRNKKVSKRTISKSKFAEFFRPDFAGFHCST